MSQDSKKTILGLDLGTNSIGWALVETDFNNKEGSIIGLGSRIIPMGQDTLSEFGKGGKVSQTAERTRLRITRRLRERHLLRRARLHRVLNILGFLPEHYSSNIDFENKLGQFKSSAEPKLAYRGSSENAPHEFIFRRSFSEMLEDFKKRNPKALVSESGNAVRVPQDWTLYYLRKKALRERIEKEELAWIILNFNQKRGYYQARGEDDAEVTNKSVDYYALKVVDVKLDNDNKKKGEQWYSIILENGWVYRRSSKVPMFDWVGLTKEFIVTTEMNEDGSIKKNKEGEERRTFRAPSEEDWTLLKKKTESEILKSGLTVGEFVYENLVQEPKSKIRGKLIRTIERRFYKEELERILLKQKEFHAELSEELLYANVVRDLYRNNETHRTELSGKDVVHLILKDIIFYQRPLRSQKSTISECKLEIRTYTTKTGQAVQRGIKVTPKSNPLFQEFRVLQWVQNLTIYTNDITDSNVTSEILDPVRDDLIGYLMSRASIDQNTLLKFLLAKKGFKGKQLTAELVKYRWNYVQDKEYPCNETGSLIRSKLEKVVGSDSLVLSPAQEKALWHLIYSVADREQYIAGLKKFARKSGIDEASFVESFKKIAPFKSDYASFSEKAINKLLLLMRRGSAWNWDLIPEMIKGRIQKLIDGEFEPEIKDKVREKSVHLKAETDFSGLPLWLAQYVIYNRHSEAAFSEVWRSPEHINSFLNDFRQHTLRNPIVEQVVTETLRVIRDIWQYYGKGKSDYFREVHIELGREMKSPANDREQMTKRNTENENKNQRIKRLLTEMAAYSEVENVRAHSPVQMEILKIYEDGVLESGIEVEEEIRSILKTPQPSSSDFRKYKLWLDQKYRSPYTGETIPLNKLFTSEYEIEHVIPQSRYFDDSYSNKVICEAAVNRLKGNNLGLEFIKKHHGEIVELGFGKRTKILEVEAYQELINKNFSGNRTKMQRLMLEDIPEKMIQRQMNDTRYISKYVMSLVSALVRDKENDDGVNSKNVVPGNGKITNELKKDWGLNDVWNDLILPRFERLNKLTNSTVFTVWNERHKKYLPTVPLEHAKGFSKKRIDHRHHAMDALVLACMTRDHVNLMNNLYAKSDTRHDLSRKLRAYRKEEYTDPVSGNIVKREVPDHFLKPWPSFTENAQEKISKVIVSFKQNIRVLNRASNYYQKWVEESGQLVKRKVKQEGVNWSVRKSLHKDTVSGKVELNWVKIPKGKIATATRKQVDQSFTLKVIESITDLGIQQILKNYLNAKGSDPEVAFSPEGIEELNKNIALYNNGKNHKPIRKVRIFEIGSKFGLGTVGNKVAKYVEAAKGTNLFFAVYTNGEARRYYETIPLNVVIERIKQGLQAVPEQDSNGNKLALSLSPNDIVFIRSAEESINGATYAQENVEPGAIYRIVSFTGGRLYAIPNNISKVILDKVELSQLNKLEFSLDEKSIREHCIKLNVDRIGRIH